MKIISKFKDYYDNVIAYGQDERCMYLRKSKSYLFDETDPLSELLKRMPDSTRDISLSKFIIGFCGKIYPVYQFTISHSYLDPVHVYCYDESDVRRFIEAHHKKIKLERYMKEDTERRWRGGWLRYSNRAPSFRRETVDAFFKEHSGSEEYQSVFEQYKTPVFMLWTKNGNSRASSPTELKVNPCLKDFNFQKVVDPYQAYQLIFQYIAMTFGVGEPKLVEISDKDKRDKHGFDDKSFKKEKTKPKGKRRRTR